MKKIILVIATVLSVQTSFGFVDAGCPSDFIGRISCAVTTTVVIPTLLTAESVDNTADATKNLFTKKEKKVLKAAVQGAIAILNSDGTEKEAEAIVQNDANHPAAILVLAQKGIKGSANDAAQLILEHSKDI